MTQRKGRSREKGAIGPFYQEHFADSLRYALSIKKQKQRIAAVKKLLQDHMVLIRSGNRKRDSGETTVRNLTEMVDTLIRLMWDQLELNSKPEDRQAARGLPSAGWGVDRYRSPRGPGLC